jgi:hypothetical protein
MGDLIPDPGLLSQRNFGSSPSCLVSAIYDAKLRKEPSWQLASGWLVLLQLERKPDKSKRDDGKQQQQNTGKMKCLTDEQFVNLASNFSMPVSLPL